MFFKIKLACFYSEITTGQFVKIPKQLFLKGMRQLDFL